MDRTEIRVVRSQSVESNQLYGVVETTINVKYYQPIAKMVSGMLL